MRRPEPGVQRREHEESAYGFRDRDGDRDAAEDEHRGQVAGELVAALDRSAERDVSGRRATRAGEGEQPREGGERPVLCVGEVERQRASVPVREQADQGEEPRQAPTPRARRRAGCGSYAGRPQHELAPAEPPPRGRSSPRARAEGDEEEELDREPAQHAPAEVHEGLGAARHLGGGVDR